VDWIHAAQDMDRLQAVVNMVICAGFHKRKEFSSLAEKPLPSPRG
jgi:hypothetical protein